MKSQLTRTAIIEVGGMLSVLSARGVEKQLVRLPGVHHADVYYVAGSAAVTFDESVIDLKAIKAQVLGCGYHCAGVLQPKHVCAPEEPPTAAEIAPAAHAGHVHEGRVVHVEHAVLAGKADTMAHEMGHGAGMGMKAIARDMRNRFFIAAAFTVPVFVYSPWAGTAGAG